MSQPVETKLRSFGVTSACIAWLPTYNREYIYGDFQLLIDHFSRPTIERSRVIFVRVYGASMNAQAKWSHKFTTRHFVFPFCYDCMYGQLLRPPKNKSRGIETRGMKNRTEELVPIIRPCRVSFCWNSFENHVKVLRFSYCCCCCYADGT